VTGSSCGTSRDATLRPAGAFPRAFTRAVPGAAPLINSERYCCTVSPGRAAFSTAAAPAINGVEKLVPLVSIKPLALYDSPLAYEFCAPVTISSPTAARSGLSALPTLGPRLEKKLTSVRAANAVIPTKSIATCKPGFCATRAFRSAPSLSLMNSAGNVAVPTVTLPVEKALFPGLSYTRIASALSRSPAAVTPAIFTSMRAFASRGAANSTLR